MRSIQIVIGAGALLLLVSGSLGCVTQGRYDDLSQERDALQAANASLEDSLRATAAEREELRVDLGKTRERLVTKETEVLALTGTYDQLVDELRTEVASGQIEIQRVIDGIRLNVSEELLFPSGSATLNDAGRALLARVAGQIKNEESVVSVEGHTDDVRVSRTLQKRYPSNWELAGARAASVVRLLTEEGVDPVRLRAVSRGPFAPIASNATEEGRAKNRRTEIILRPIPL